VFIIALTQEVKTSLGSFLNVESCSRD